LFFFDLRKLLKMGGKQAKPAYSGLRKKVVIVGASFGGHKCA
jgi:hypothetical protein